MTSEEVIAHLQSSTNHNFIMVTFIMFNLQFYERTLSYIILINKNKKHFNFLSHAPQSQKKLFNMELGIRPGEDTPTMAVEMEIGGEVSLKNWFLTQ